LLLLLVEELESFSVHVVNECETQRVRLHFVTRYSLLKGAYADFLRRVPVKPPLERRHSYEPLVDEDVPKRAVDSQSSVKAVGTPPPSMGILSNIAIGCLAGAATQLVVNPLTLIQTRVMTDKKSQSSGFVGTLLNAVQTEGIASLWNGLIPSLVLTVNPAIQFLVFDKLKAWWLSRAEQETPPRKHLSALELMIIGSMYGLLR